MTSSTFCLRDACPEYQKRAENKNKECSISGRLPGNMTACPLADSAPVEVAAPVWAETIAREAVAEPGEPALAEVYHIDTEIAALKHKILALSARRVEAVEDVIISGELDQADGYGNVYHLRAHVRTVRVLESDLLRERQPAVFDAIAALTWTVTIADARRHLGDDEITACSTSRTTRSWVVVCEQSEQVGGLEARE